MLKPRASRRPAAPAVPATAEGSSGNDQALTVSALSGALKRTVEDRFGYVRVRGEVSGYRGPHSSGHAYFALKDDAARIDAVVWKASFARLRVKPEEGMDVIASGKLTTYPGKSSYQIVIDDIEPAGIGALMASLEERRARLAAEGLFDAARKRPIPYLPGVIGVITSPTGAVIRDIIHRVAARFPTHLLVWPVRVQGETAAAEVTRAIQGFNALQAGDLVPVPQLLIVARGGGSLEDLWGFNDEALVRAAAASRIPLIAAVGHETDWTLIDHAADLRAPTPTGAAELAVPVRLDLLATLDGLAGRQSGAASRLLDERRRALRATARLLPAGPALLAPARQRLDLAAARLPDALRIALTRHRLDLLRLGGRLATQAPRARLARLDGGLAELGRRLSRAGQTAALDRRRRLATAADRLAAAVAARLRLAAETNRRRRRDLANLEARAGRALAAARERRAARLAALAQLLGSFSYRGVLERGFALVRDAEGQPVRSAAVVPDGALLRIEFSDGRRDAVAGSPGEAPRRLARPPKEPVKPPKRKPRDQGSLF